MKTKHIFILIIIGLLANIKILAQQDAQYAQYMHNTLSFNPAYAGSREVLSFTGLYRTQWLGLEGAPQTYTLSGHAPIKNRLGAGVNITRDEIFITEETYLDIAISYTIPFSRDRNLAFGIKGGGQLLNIDFTALNNFGSNDMLFVENIDNKFAPQVGAGAFYYTSKWYAGLSVPNILETEHFDRSTISGLGEVNSSELAKERINFYAMAGYLYDVTPDITLKPSFLFKWVLGAPLQLDVNASVLFYNKFILGASYRWSAALTGMAGFQVTNQLLLGVAYDRETTELVQFNTGSLEFLLRYELFNKKRKIAHPRFF